MGGSEICVPRAAEFALLSLPTIQPDDVQQLCESETVINDFVATQDVDWRSLDEATEPIDRLHSWMMDTCANPKLHMGNAIYCWESLYYIIHRFEMLEAKPSHKQPYLMMIFVVNNVYDQEPQLVAFR